MPLPLGPAAKAKVTHLLYSHWKPAAIAEELRSDGIRCGVSTIYEWSQRLQIYGTMGPLPQAQRANRPRRLLTAAKQALLEY